MAVTHGCRPSRALGLGLSHLPRSGMLQGWFDARVQDWESGKANKGNLAWSKNEALGFGFFCKSNFPASGTATVTRVEINFCTLKAFQRQELLLSFETWQLVFKNQLCTFCAAK